MRSAPSQMAATLEALSTSMTMGNRNAISWPARSAVAVTSWLTPAKRSLSSGSRTNARTTRIPVICSRSTSLSESMRICITRNCGTMRRITLPTPSSRAGMLTSRMPDRSMSSCSANTTPPTNVIGATTSRVHVISTSICTCWTSFVIRVISDGAPNAPTSRAENDGDAMEQLGAHVAPEAHRRPGSEVDGGDREQDLHGRDGEHDGAGVPDVRGVACDDPLVDDVGVERRQVQRQDRLDRLEDDHGDQHAPVASELISQQPHQHDDDRALLMGTTSSG